MSSRRHRQRREESNAPSNLPVTWSAWEWNDADNYKCYTCYAQTWGPGADQNGYIYEHKTAEELYGKTQPRTPVDPGPIAPTPSIVYRPQETAQNPHQQPYSAKDDAPDNYMTTNASREHTRRQSNAGNSRGMDQVTAAMAGTRLNSGYMGATHIASNNDRSYEKFDKNYKIHKEHEFKQYRVFKVLWSEPQGENGNGGSSHNTESIREGRNGNSTHAKVRRFVIIAAMRGHCLCLPINTYLKQGTLKSGVHAADHTIVYTAKPSYLPGERNRGMHRTPVRIESSTPRDKLEPTSRLNYAKVYTVEYNVKVCFIGKVHKDSRNDVAGDYNQVHPPMKLNPTEPMPADTVHYSEGVEPAYPQIPVNYERADNFDPYGQNARGAASREQAFPELRAYATSDYPYQSRANNSQNESGVLDSYALKRGADSAVEFGSSPQEDDPLASPTVYSTEQYSGLTDTIDEEIEGNHPHTFHAAVADSPTEEVDEEEEMEDLYTAR